MAQLQFVTQTEKEVSGQSETTCEPHQRSAWSLNMCSLRSKPCLNLLLNQ